ncbi:MAG: pyridoxal-phosphate dependent enzyme [Anaerolineae bacterium]|nr:pyridoxal-phosphate dependent enzyme [Anaerolineae bacterium]
MTTHTLHLETPMFENPAINQRLGKRIFLKMDCYQPVGSFKIRGIGALCQQAVRSGFSHLVCSSGGNAGYAAAYAGRRLHTKVTVVVPETTSETAKNRIRAEGAEVIIRGRAWDEANTYALELVKKVNGAYIHPFENPTIWDGHASLIDEVKRQCPKPDVVVVSVGGGGLLCGILEGLHRNGWGNVPVLAVETEGANSLAASVEAGQLITLPQINSIATTLGAKTVTPKLMEWVQKHDIRPLVVADKTAVAACLRFADDLRVVVEPACGASLSVLYEHADVLADFESVLMVVCGGAGVSIEQLWEWELRL